MPGRLSNEAYQARAKQLQRTRERQHRNDMLALLAQPWGRRLLYWLVFELGQLEAPSFHPTVKDGVAAAMHMSHDEGQREMARTLLEEIQGLNPAAFLQMMKEQIESRLDALDVEQPSEDGEE